MSYGQPCNRMTGGPSVGPSSAYPTLSRPASTCLRAGNEVRPALVGGAAGGVEEHAAAEGAATAATPIASENSRPGDHVRPLLMGDMPPAEKTWTCTSIVVNGNRCQTSFGRLMTSAAHQRHRRR